MTGLLNVGNYPQMRDKHLDFITFTLYRGSHFTGTPTQTRFEKSIVDTLRSLNALYGVAPTFSNLYLGIGLAKKGAPNKD